jgi:hypothetical protein
MAGEPLKTMGGGCLGGLIGAFLGVVIGGLVGGNIDTSTPQPRVDVEKGGGSRARNIQEGTAEVVGTVALGFAEVSAQLTRIALCAAIGGIIGALGGSVLGAGLAAKASTARTREHPSGNVWRPGLVPERPTESTAAELARLREWVAELEGKKQNDERFKEARSPS